MIDPDTVKALTEPWCRYVLNTLLAIQHNTKDAAGNTLDLQTCYRIAERGGLIQGFTKWTSVREAWAKSTEFAEESILRGEMPQGARQDAVKPQAASPQQTPVLEGDWDAFMSKYGNRYNLGVKLTKESWMKIRDLVKANKAAPDEKLDDTLKHISWAEMPALCASIVRAAVWGAP